MFYQRFNSEHVEFKSINIEIYFLREKFRKMVINFGIFVNLTKKKGILKSSNHVR